MLAKLAVEDQAANVRKAAVEKLTDQEWLAKVVVEGRDTDVRGVAVGKLTDETLLTNLQIQAVLAKLAGDHQAAEVRKATVEKLTDQAVLAKIAVKDQVAEVRRAAVKKLTGQSLLAKIAMQDASLDVRITAISKVTDQVLLQRWAANNPQAAIRLASVKGITDDQFLVRRLSVESSAAVRAAIVETLHTETSLQNVAVAVYRKEERLQALQRLRSMEGNRAVDAEAAQRALEERVTAISQEADGSTLLAQTLRGEFDVLRYAAANRLNHSTKLEQAALHSRDREVLKILLAKLEDKTVLKRIASASDDRAMRLAVAYKAGTKSWKDIFNAATAKGTTVEMLGDALAAVSLFSSAQEDAKAAVQQACLNLIRLGDESRIPEMVDLLEGYGDKILGEDYLNSSQPDLDNAGRAWAHRRGYNVGIGPGSHRATWGSGR